MYYAISQVIAEKLKIKSIFLKPTNVQFTFSTASIDNDN